MEISGSRVLVTGGAGFIGSHVVDLLVSRGCRVRVLDNLDPQIHSRGRPRWIPEGVELLHGRVESPDDVALALDGVDLVFHEVGLTSFVPSTARYLEVNAVGTAVVMEAVAKRGRQVAKVVVASSQSIYGEGKYECRDHGWQYPEIRTTEQLLRGEWEPICHTCGASLRPVPTDEGSATNASTPYAIGKLAGERLAVALGAKYEIPTVALRYGVTYGPRQSVSNPYGGVVPTFAARLLNGRSPVLYEDGGQLRDWIFVGDVARANLFVMEDDRTAFQVYNIGTGVGTTVRRIAQLLADGLGQTTPPETSGQFRPGDIRHLVHDMRKLTVLGFRTETPLEAGLGRFLDWFRGLGGVADPYPTLEEDLLSAGSLLASS